MKEESTKLLGRLETRRPAVRDAAADKQKADGEDNNTAGGRETGSKDNSAANTLNTDGDENEKAGESR